MIEAFTECTPAQEKACYLFVGEKYVHNFPIGRKLLAEDPDGGGPKVAFPMSVENGLLHNSIQYKIVSLDIHQDDVCEVVNGTVQ
jgi:hypothetical protein